MRTMSATNKVRRTVLLALFAPLTLASGCIWQRSGGQSGPSEMTDDAGSSTGNGFPSLVSPTEDVLAPPPLGACAFPGLLPDFGDTPTTASTPPPPISGGTLIVTRDGSRAIASDPDRDAVYVVDLATKAVSFTLALQPGDEPGRLAEDGQGLVHVALRGSGMLATIDPIAGAVTARRKVCPAPRGVAWQASNDTLWVACATGELASLPPSGGSATLVPLERDLRDVIVTGDTLAVTEFRSASVVRLTRETAIARKDRLPAQPQFASHVAWRAIAGPSGSIIAVHQQESLQSLSTHAAGGYGWGGAGPELAEGHPLPVPPPGPGPVLPDAGGADAATVPPRFESTREGGGAVQSLVTILDADGTTEFTSTFQGVLPVDVALSPSGNAIAAVGAGNGPGPVLANLFLFAKTNASIPDLATRVGEGSAIAVAFANDDDVIVQTREPAALWITAWSSVEDVDAAGALEIPLSTASRADTGHDIFHTHAGALLACASCHPEGGDDGHVWILDGQQRRTPSLRGTIAGTAPYHWSGNEANLAAIVSDVYVVRMSGAMLTEPQLGALSSWINSIPAPPAPAWVDPGAAAAGRAVFDRPEVGCAACHSGTKFTDNRSHDVGTGGTFQAPPLVGVGWRTPLLHSGCANTIADRFGACATSGHGNLASLSPADIANLTAYLETL